MKILAFTDLHSDAKALGEIKKKAISEKPDVIICAGDISIFGNNFIYLVGEINELKIPFLIIPGNHEDESLVKSAEKIFENVKCLHNSFFVKGDCVFFGFGGGGFGHIDKKFESAVQRFKKLIVPEKSRLILVTHAPPYGTKLDKIHGSHTGNKSIRDFIEQAKPVLAVCGHLHENEGKEDKLFETKIINPGYLGKIIII